MRFPFILAQARPDSPLRKPEEFDDAIQAWKDSIALQPSSPDAHTSKVQLNLVQILCFRTKIRVASRLSRSCQCLRIIPNIATRSSVASSKVTLTWLRARTQVPDATVSSRRIAATLSPDDPEIAFNLAAVLEASEFNPPTTPQLYCFNFLDLNCSRSVGRGSGAISKKQRPWSRAGSHAYPQCW